MLMKKILYFLFSALTVIAVASCAKKEIEEQQPATPDPVEEELELVDMTFSAGADLARVYIAEGGTKLYWEEGDDIAIFDNLNPETPRKFEILNINDNTADFNGQVAKGSTEFYAVYPYSAAKSLSVSDGNLEATLPGEQKLGEHNASQGAFLAVGKVKNGNIEFVNVFGRIKVVVTYEDVSEIIVSGDNMSGTATFNSETGELVSVSDAKGSAKLLPKEGDTVFTPGTYYLSLLPGTTEAGKFSVTMKRPVINYDGELAYSATQVATGPVPVKRGGGINFADIDTKLTWTIHLGNKAELLAWNNAYLHWKVNDNVYLDNDIELDNEPVEWTSHPFPGTFDGQGYAITKIHVEKAGDANFFGTVSGTVKNLTFGAESDDNSYFRCTATSGGSLNVAPIASVSDGGQLTDLRNYASVEVTGKQGIYVGGICGRYGSTKKMSGCINYGNVTYSASTGTTPSISGIIGNITKKTTIENCENHANVTFDGETTGNTVNHGGIVAYCAYAATLENCVNTGNLAISSNMDSASGTYRIGGIMGTNQGAGVTFIGCRNTGEVRCDAVGFNLKSLCLGGILGQNESESTDAVVMEDCTNSGDVTNSTDDAAGNTYIGGMIGNRDYKSASAVGEMTRCTNLGNLLDESKKTSGTATYIGGMIGYNDIGISLTDCKNGMDGGNCGQITRSVTGNKSNYIAIGGMIGRQLGSKDYGTMPVSLLRCHNYASITSNAGSDGTYVYLGSMIAANNPASINGNDAFYNVTIDGCVNDGAITNHTNSSSQIRMGGFIGDGANYFDLKNSINNGNVMSDGNSVATGDNVSKFQYRVGGFVGSITKGGNNNHKFTNLYNHGNVIATATSTSPATPVLEVGGILGFLNYTDKFIDCKCNAVISSTGATKKWARAIVGNTSKDCTISNCGVAGEVAGTVLNSENFGEFIHHSTGKVTATNPNYYLGSSNNEQYSPLDNDINLE